MDEIALHNRYNIRIRYADTDKMGYVYNGMYLTFFEIGRTETMRAYGLPYSNLETEGFFLPVIESHVRYYSPAFYDDILTIEAFLNYKNTARIKFEYNILRGDTTIAKGYTVHTFISAETRKPVRPPKFFLEALAKCAKIIDEPEV